MRISLNTDLAVSSVPRFYPETYTDKVEGFLLVYAPLSEKGLVVLNKDAAFLYSLIDGKRMLKDIWQSAQKEVPKIGFSVIKQTFQDFYASEIIHFGKPKTTLELSAKKIKTISVWLHITNQCNLRCTYCYVRKTVEKMSPAVGKKAIDKVYRTAQKHAIEKVTLKFSGGEALLELPMILTLVKQAKSLSKKYGIETDFVVLSNGILIDEKVAKILKGNNLRVAVSLDGLKKYHDRTRIFPSGIDSFDLVIKGINNLMKAKVPFNVSITISAKNIDGIPELTRYLLDRNIHFAFNFYRENPFVTEELEGNDKKLVERLKKAYQYLYDNPPEYPVMDSLLDRVHFSKPHLHPCGMGHSYLVINHQGELSSCQMTLEKSIGSIDDPDLMETMIKGNFVRPIGLTVLGKTPCRNCQWKYLCGGGCPLLTYQQKGRYDTSSPYCSVYKALIPEVLRIEAKRLIKYGVR
ncbi:radical SAM protein [Candidatus Microgenomates bacterium]|nr:radical SAM protein [Candidatus Microgenomates bacterium]